MLVIFDWDGTLIDSTSKIVRSMQEAARRVNLPPLSDDAVRNIIGLGLPEAILTLYPEVDLAGRQDLRNAYSEVYIEADRVPCSLYEGVEQGLLELEDAGHSVAIATGKSRAGLNRVLANLGWLNRFRTTRCADETASKPHPLMLHEIMQECRVDARDVVMVGDTEYDLAMAVNAKVHGVGVSYGAHEASRLLLHSPIAVIDHFSELNAVLRLAE